MTDATEPTTIAPALTVPRSEDVMRIIELIENGSSERAACEKFGMNRGTFRSRALKLGAADHYARAIEGLARDQVEQIEIAIEKLENGTFDAQTMKAIVDARKWIASKLFPRQWGDKTAITGGSETDAPIKVRFDPGSLTPEQLAALAAVKVEGE